MVDVLKRQGSALQAPNQALLEACTAQRLRANAPDGWTSATDFDRVLDVLWSGVAGQGTEALFETAIHKIEDLMPHTDDCEDELNGLGVQAALIAAESGLRCLLRRDLGSLAGQEYRFETARASATMARFGVIQLGSGDKEDAFESSLLDDDIIQVELAEAEADLQFASRWDGGGEALAIARKARS